MREINGIWRTLAALIGFAALIVLTGGAAQGADRPKPPERPVNPGASPMAEASAPLTLDEELERLFADLATPGATDWEATQQAILNIWSRSGSDSMDLLLKRGHEAVGEEALDKAIDHLSALVELAPDFAEGWNARATAYFLDDQYDRSIADIARALALNPRHFGALAGLGMIFERYGDKKNALNAYREALRLNPHLAGPEQAVRRLEPEVDGRGI